MFSIRTVDSSIQHYLDNSLLTAGLTQLLNPRRGQSKRRVESPDSRSQEEAGQNSFVEEREHEVSNGGNGQARASMAHSRKFLLVLPTCSGQLSNDLSEEKEDKKK